MAIYHLSATTISRSSGRSAVAASAYRSASMMVDERTGVTHDYTQKSDVAETDILLPEGASAWMGEREKLWNAAEAGERRKDAQLAREVTISLPQELDVKANWALAQTFVRDTFVSRGMVADVCFHLGDKSGDAQPHVHVMLTMRDIDGDGFGAKNRSWNQKALLCEWRESWAHYCNQALMMHGIDARVDHRTLEAQGINLEPQSKIGPTAAKAKMARFRAHQELARRNGERILTDPFIAFHALTCQHSTFTDSDIARFVNRHTVDVEQFQHVHARLKAYPELVRIGEDDRGRVRFSTRTRVRDEHTLLNQSYELSRRSNHVVLCPAHILVAESARPLSQAQVDAVTHLLESKDMACLVGIAGSGKSTLLESARHQWEVAGFKVKGATLAGIAAQNLQESSEIASRTIASWCHRWDKGEDRLTRHDVLVVDEAGMIDVPQALRLVSEVKKRGAKLVLIGDPEQLQAIGPGSPFRAIVDEIGAYHLDTVYRQREAWQQVATKAFARRETGEGLDAYMAHEHVHSFETKAVAMQGLMADWQQSRRAHPDDTSIVLAYHRSSVRALNEMARTLLQAEGHLGVDVEIETEQGARQFASGDRVYFLKNDYHDLDVKNGTLGTVTSLDKHSMQVRLDPLQGESRDVTVNLSAYNHLDHGYAATVHKSQGVTVDRSFVLASKRFDSHVSYVSMSRHRASADLYYSKEDFPSTNALERHLSQSNHKEMTTDFTARRGLEEAPIEHGDELAHEKEVPKLTEEAEKSAAARLIERAASARDVITSYFDSEKRETRAMEKSIDDLNEEREARAAQRLEARQMEKAFENFKQRYNFEDLSTSPQKGDFGQSLGVHHIGGEEFHIVHNADTNKTFATRQVGHSSFHPHERVVFEYKPTHYTHNDKPSWVRDHSPKNVEKQHATENTMAHQHEISQPKNNLTHQIDHSMDHDHGIDM